MVCTFPYSPDMYNWVMCWAVALDVRGFDEDVLMAASGRNDCGQLNDAAPRAGGARNAIRVSLHAHQEMVEEDITYRQFREVLCEPRIVENYPDTNAECCLVCR